MAVYNNSVVQQYLNEVLNTLLPVEAFVNVDNSLVGAPGDSVTVWRYSGSGAAEEVTEGNGNSGYSDVDGTSYKYQIKMVQDRVKVTDEELQRNPLVQEYKLKVLAGHLVNKVRADVVGEWQKSLNVYGCTAAVPSFTELFTGVGLLDLGLDGGENGGAEDYRIFMSPAAWRAFQIGLASLNVDIQYDLINGKRTPFINGIPVDITDLLKDAKCQVLVATNQAVRFLKAASVTSEQERYANIRTTEHYGRDNYLAALEFEKKVVRFGKGIECTLVDADCTVVGIADGAAYIEGDKVNFTVTAPEGEALASVKIGSTAITPVDGVYSITVPSADFTITCTLA